MRMDREQYPVALRYRATETTIFAATHKPAYIKAVFLKVAPHTA